MSVDIRIKNAVKRYGENTVIKDLSVEIKEGEFFTLLGPSGCGKTTLLRMIAGFNSIEGGAFFFGERRVNDMDPAKRNIGMVFQNYAIFPNMTVKDNVAFGLKNRKVPKDQCEKETDEFLKLMQIDEYRDRMPERLSGGQQQRVALARALVIKPDVLLMDEPLSNLDAKLRVEMRTAIKEIQNRIGITTVYVTHDQEEAMAVSDRIAVMDGGVIQQIGRPRDLFVGTTLNGYVKGDETMDGPNFELARQIVEKVPAPLIAEGRIHRPEQARAMLELGVLAVVVGGAITRPLEIARRFVTEIEKAQVRP
uniref:N-acylglucosamine-6-phosphate 2-epimerase n=1 Tax=uncultured prokaryote TaxID=198431 RepID=A0A0H5PXQ9_9ZZZZ|nr:hypothetical protein [uncultured prokaryote]